MSNILTLHDNMLHLWRVDVSDFGDQVADLRGFLSPDEITRADRFRIDFHRQRFTITRALLRKTIGLYLALPPQDVIFLYGKHGKPQLSSSCHSHESRNPSGWIPTFVGMTRRVTGRTRKEVGMTKEIQNLHFNVSHSESFALFAFMLHQEVGVDIEKISSDFKEGIAKRFFSKKEYESLMQLPEEKRAAMFYEYWARKEAILKARGTGLFQDENAEKHPLYAEIISIHPDYKAAFATFSPPKMITHLQWTRDHYIVLK